MMAESATVHWRASTPKWLTIGGLWPPSALGLRICLKAVESSLLEGPYTHPLSQPRFGVSSGQHERPAQ
jgi:hypothetical protein